MVILIPILFCSIILLFCVILFTLNIFRLMSTRAAVLRDGQAPRARRTLTNAILLLRYVRTGAVAKTETARLFVSVRTIMTERITQVWNIHRTEFLISPT